MTLITRVLQYLYCPCLVVWKAETWTQIQSRSPQPVTLQQVKTDCGEEKKKEKKKLINGYISELLPVGTARFYKSSTFKVFIYPLCLYRNKFGDQPKHLQSHDEKNSCGTCYFIKNGHQHSGLAGHREESHPVFISFRLSIWTPRIKDPRINIL